MSEKIEVWQIEGFLDLLKDSFSVQALTEFLAPKSYTFPNGTFRWMEVFGRPLVLMEYNIDNDPLLFQWPYDPLGKGWFHSGGFSIMRDVNQKCFGDYAQVEMGNGVVEFTVKRGSAEDAHSNMMDVDQQSKIQDPMLTDGKVDKSEGTEIVTESTSNHNTDLLRNADAGTVLDRHMVGELARVSISANPNRQDTEEGAPISFMTNTFREHQPLWDVPFRFRKRLASMSSSSSEPPKATKANIVPSNTESPSPQLTNRTKRTSLSTTSDKDRHRLPDDAPGSTISSSIKPKRVQHRRAVSDLAPESIASPGVQDSSNSKRHRLPDDAPGSNISSSVPSKRTDPNYQKRAKYRLGDWAPVIHC
jgi:hypothetical protein